MSYICHKHYTMSSVYICIPFFRCFSKNGSRTKTRTFRFPKRAWKDEGRVTSFLASCMIHSGLKDLFFCFQIRIFTSPPALGENKLPLLHPIEQQAAWKGLQNCLAWMHLAMMSCCLGFSSFNTHSDTIQSC